MYQNDKNTFPGLHKVYLTVFTVHLGDFIMHPGGPIMHPGGQANFIVHPGGNAPGGSPNPISTTALW